VLKSMLVSYVRGCCKVESSIISVSMVRAKGGEVVCSIRPRSHKASKAKGLRGEVRKVIKRMGGDGLRKLRNKGRRGWDCILGIGCGVSSI
jgi:hypothetical protein